MRIAIIILGILGLLTLALNWDALSPCPNSVPKEGYIIHSAHAPTCNKCDKTFAVQNSKKTKNTCTKYMCVATNF